MLFVGDVHGKIDQYRELIEFHKPKYSIQDGTRFVCLGELRTFGE